MTLTVSQTLYVDEAQTTIISLHTTAVHQRRLHTNDATHLHGAGLFPLLPSVYPVHFPNALNVCIGVEVFVAGIVVKSNFGVLITLNFIRS